jgi:SAM-dependent methyltransferase
MSLDDLNEWDEIAETYDRVAGTAQDLVYGNLKTALWSALGDVRGRTILELGCGSGWLAAQLTEKGAKVVGIDGSAELIRRAQARSPTGQWILHDLRNGLPKLEQRAIDVVVSHMTLMDFDPLDPMLGDLGALLSPRPRIIITMPHPGFFNYKSAEEDGATFRKVRNYLRSEAWKIESYGGHTHYHRPLSYYVNLFARYGFCLIRFEEPEFKNETPVFCLLQFSRAAA